MTFSVPLPPPFPLLVSHFSPSLSLSGVLCFSPTFLSKGNEFFSRDVSGTVFSLVMIVVLVLSMYLLMKHRMQVIIILPPPLLFRSLRRPFAVFRFSRAI